MTATMMTNDEILPEIKKSRERVNHFSQWKNEPAMAKKLRHWKRRLKKAIAAAKTAKLTIPADPYAPPPPPPPPPTEEELRGAAVESAKKRVNMSWMIQPGSKAWAPWGASGWSAVVVTKTHHIWCRVNRVNAKTGEGKLRGKVRRDQLVKRDPEKAGKDRPEVLPTEVFTEVSADSVVEHPTAEPQDKPTLKPAVVRTPEEEAAFRAKINELLTMLDDSTTDDW